MTVVRRLGVRRLGVRTAAGLVAPLLLVPVAACGSDADDASGGAYCATVKEHQAVFTDDGTGLGLVTNLPKIQEMAAEAPDDLQDEWQVFIGALQGLRDAIASVGLKPTDFVDANPPAGVTASEQTTISTAADRLAQADVTEAAAGIEQQAKDVCKLQLGL